MRWMLDPQRPCHHLFRSSAVSGRKFLQSGNVHTFDKGRMGKRQPHGSAQTGPQLALLCEGLKLHVLENYNVGIYELFEPQEPIKQLNNPRVPAPFET